MKIVIFGTGKYYQKRKEKISLDTEIVALLDNDLQLQGKKLDGIQVFSPHKIKQLSFDKVVLMSVKAKEMKEQLIKLDVLEADIWSWEQLNSEMWHGTFRLYVGSTELEIRKKKILMISTGLNYDGGSLAIIYAALVLQRKGFYVILAAQSGDARFIDEATDAGINIMICQGLPYLRKEELFFIKHFDMVIVNVFPMLLSACEISLIMPTMWWIHESKEIYKGIIDQFPQYANRERFKRISIYAVSSIAQNNFNYYFPGCAQKTLFYGIPDQTKEDILEKKKDSFVFAIIGSVNPGKAQDIFIRAAKLLKNKNENKIQFWIVGFIGNDKYSNRVKELVSQDAFFKLWGQLTRCEMQEIYRKIDVVVCPSMEDCLPIVVTEGMMHRKVCIVSDHTGSAKLIDDGINGYVVPVGDVFALKKKMELIINNKEKYDMIGRNARKTYERYFSMEVFGDNLDKAVKETVYQWKLSEK